MEECELRILIEKVDDIEYPLELKRSLKREEELGINCYSISFQDKTFYYSSILRRDVGLTLDDYVLLNINDIEKILICFKDNLKREKRFFKKLQLSSDEIENYFGQMNFLEEFKHRIKELKQLLRFMKKKTVKEKGVRVILKSVDKGV